jgi:hypothetical protein
MDPVDMTEQEVDPLPRQPKKDKHSSRRMERPVHSQKNISHQCPQSHQQAYLQASSQDAAQVS